MILPNEHHHYMNEYEQQYGAGVTDLSYLEWLAQFDPANDPNFYEDDHIEPTEENGNR
jgi:hypothetical protein